MWLSENPFYFDCKMIWMIEWLSNFTIQGKHGIADYKDIRCNNGKMKGKQIYLLNPVDMGCYPSELTIQEKVGVSIGSVLAALLVIGLLILVIRRSRDIKFFVFYYCKCFGLPGDSKHENLQKICFDDYLCYR